MFDALWGVTDCVGSDQSSVFWAQLSMSEFWWFHQYKVLCFWFILSLSKHNMFVS